MEASSPESAGQASEQVAPEVLKPQGEAGSESPESTTPTNPPAAPKDAKRLRRGPYKPSHKATFIGLAVVIAILSVNAGVIAFVLKSNNKTKDKANDVEVAISQDTLSKLGINRDTIGSAGVELVVNPDARFNGKLEVGGDVSVAGQLKLNSKFSANDASLTQLQAGNTALAQLNVNGNSTLTNLNVRSEVVVAGTSRLQGDVVITKLLTVNNNVNVAGSLAVGGALSVRTLQVSSLVTDTTLTIGGHIITRGSAPGLTPGTALGSNGTVSISGNDAAGTVAANVGVGSGGGIVATVNFRLPYGATPHIVVTAVGSGLGSVYVNRSATGFSIGVNGAIPPGGYAFDYIVMQ